MAAAPRDLTEAADLLVVLLAWCGITETTMAELIGAAWRKQVVNEQRRWEIGADGVRRHV